MMAWVFLAALGLIFAVVWINLAKRPHPRAKIGPDGTNVRNPESFVVHHEGKGQGLDIANTALKERTEHLRRDLPGEAHKVKAPVPGRDLVAMDAPPSDVSRYGDQKVAPGTATGHPEQVAGGPVPGDAGGETKAKVLMEGPKGSRPGTPEEPGSSYAKGRRVTDNHRDIEASAELLANPYPGTRRKLDREMAASPSTNGQEPGYGLGRTHPGGSDGEGGADSPVDANAIHERSADSTDSRGRVVAFRNRPGAEGPTRRATAAKLAKARAGTEDPEPDSADDDEPDVDLPEQEFQMETAGELQPERDWSALHEEIPLPDRYSWDVVTAVIRDPRSVYVYWEQGGTSESELKERLGEQDYHKLVPCLRIREIGGTYLQTIDLHDHDTHWFIHEGLEPGHSYIISFERRTPTGVYHHLSETQPIHLPHEGPSDKTLAMSGHLYRAYGGRPGDVAGSPWR